MGGNALSVITTRLQTRQYNEVCTQVMKTLDLELLNKRKCVIQAYAGKTDFGDADILIEGGEGYDPNELAKALNATEIVRNGDVTSIGVKVKEGIFQVDLIKIAPESYEFAKRYLAVNDLGNLLGRIAHKAGFKLGHLGLMYVLRNPDNNSHVIAELPITRDWNEALEFIGYDSKRYQAGYDGEFKKLADVFNFVVSSPYFNKDIYLLENRNAVSRVRDAKRKTYTEFLLWCNTDHEKDFPNFDWSDRDGIKQKFVSMAREKFPEFSTKLDEIFVQWEREKVYRSKLNGSLVAYVTGLSGKDLGELMKEIKKNSFKTEDELKKWVISASHDDIVDFIYDRQNAVRHGNYQSQCLT